MSAPKTHGENNRNSREYRSWYAMRQRCYNPKHNSFHNYGGRGIKICERWNSYELFLKDMGRCPPKLSLERIKNDLDYGPSNCCWADTLTQRNNTRTNRFVECFGKRQTIAQWAGELGFRYETLLNRINQGWPLEIALSKAPSQFGPNIAPHTSQKLKPEQVLEIRRRAAAGEKTGSIVKSFPVRVGMIRDIVRRVYWNRI